MISLVVAISVLSGRVATPALAVSVCVGDCDGDGAVTVDEILVGVNMVLGDRPLGACPSFDRAGTGVVSVSDLVAAVNAALSGCPTPPPTATESPTPTPTATPTVNRAPEVSALAVYRTYPGKPIQLQLQATDPEGTPLHYGSEALPDGSTLDETSGVFEWTPSAGQVDAYSIPVSVRDDGVPAQSAAGTLPIKVSPLDACTQPSCDPASGCTSTPEPVTTTCCRSGPPARVAEPAATCPGAAVVFVGRNVFGGFGRLRNCDSLRMSVSGQGGPGTIRYNVQARCLDISEPLVVRTRIEAGSRLVSDYAVSLALHEAANGYQQATLLSVPIRGGGPFFDLENSEANVTVTLTDKNNVSLSGQVRVVLTSSPLNELPETP